MGSVKWTVMLVLMLSWTSDLLAGVWTVGGSGADFSEIQPAVDAALPGDTILVRPGSYGPLLVEKGVLVRASEGMFLLGFGATIRNIPAGSTAGISGATTVGYPIQVRNNVGEVLLESLSLQAGEHTLWVDNCANVSVTGANVSLSAGLGGDAVLIESSTVRVSDYSFQGGSGGLFIARDGGAALRVADSRVALALGSLFGGHGTNGICPGSGGAALVSLRSEIHLVGDGTGQLEGGHGGDSADVSCSGGHGGHAVESQQSTLWVSQMALVGGQGGGGPGVLGQSGQSAFGNTPLFDHRVPQLSIDGDLNPGDTLHLELAVEEAGSVLLFLGGAGGWLELGSLGPGLGVLPGVAWFGRASLGPTSPSNPVVIDFALATEVPPGFIFHTQGFVFAESGGIHCSNKVVRTLGE